MGKKIFANVSTGYAGNVGLLPIFVRARRQSYKKPTTNEMIMWPNDWYIKANNYYKIGNEKVSDLRGMKNNNTKLTGIEVESPNKLVIPGSGHHQSACLQLCIVGLQFAAIAIYLMQLVHQLFVHKNHEIQNDNSISSSKANRQTVRFNMNQVFRPNLFQKL